MELMIALVIGFIILGSIMLMTSSSDYSGQRSGTQARLDEDAQLVLAILGPQIRMAGYSAAFNDRTDGVAYRRFSGAGLRGCDNGFANPQVAPWNGSATQRHSFLLTCGGAAGDGAAISVMYEADALNTLPGPTGRPSDCIGSEPAAVPSSLVSQGVAADATTVTVIENRYTFEKDGATLTLYCSGNGITNANPIPFSPGNKEPLISNIESVQVLYGVSAAAVPATSATGLQQYGNQVVGYLTAAQLDAQFTNTTDPDNDRWMRVVNVKLCVTIRSEKEEMGDPIPYVNCAGTVVIPNDKFVRRTAQATFALRNRSSTL